MEFMAFNRAETNLSEIVYFFRFKYVLVLKHQPGEIANFQMVLLDYSKLACFQKTLDYHLGQFGKFPNGIFDSMLFFVVGKIQISL